MSVQQKLISNYSQQDATFLDLFISKDGLHVSGGSSAHHQEQTVEAALVLSTNTAASCYRGGDGTSISSTVAASNSIGWQYLKLYVQLCAPNDGGRNCLKHVERM